MPLMIPVSVNIPTTRVINYEALQKELTRYAQDFIDSGEDELEVMSSTELAGHTITADELRSNLHTFVSEKFKQQIV
ncbi:MAG: hypothetical protein MJZ79_03135 [Paludibacteraceae bacterium]|nr:hypothetical protein [Paludibacteraceae bacterium]